MRTNLIVVALCGVALLGAANPKSAHPSAAPNPQERSAVTHHHIVLGSRTIDYTATAGTLIIKSDKGEPEASVFYVAYTQDGADRNHRPVTFIYNGGPGCASAPLHMMAWGPRRVELANAAPTSGPPSTLVDNQYTLLDKSDIIFIDAPGTGYSHLLPKVDPKTVYGIDQDAAAFAAFIDRYITLNDRWNSPKYLFGESYGTPRSAALVNYLQSNDAMNFNGVVLLSSVLDFGTIAPGPGNDLAYVDFVPTEAAVHWYHDKAATKPSLQSVVDEARTFANGPYATALLQGDRLPHDQFVKIAGELARITGLSEAYVEKADLRIVPERFEKELLLESGETVGRLDGRYTGYDLDPLGDSAEYDPADAYNSPALQAAFLSYVRDDLNWKSDEKYPQCVGSVNEAWDYTRKSVWNWLSPTTSPDLQQAMTLNPNLRVFVGAGYFDMATPFGAAEWTFSHMQLHPALRSHVTFGYYESGHMVYANIPSLAKFHADLDSFYDATDH
jgi:carboxypeptidase C (cathepsin A)